jgi:pyruvate formate lyase activating enzyme
MIREAALAEPAGEGKVLCRLCAHRCLVADGKYGLCGVRQNRDGRLVTHVYGEVIAAHVDPIEKKPLFHFLPGTLSFSVATIGCNFRCGFCQNWQISQSSTRKGGLGGQALSPEQAVQAAVAEDCRSIAYTYTEPTIFFEYAQDIARLAKVRGLGNVFVTNGFMTPEALEAARDWLDAANVDLKSFRDETYRKVCGGRLQPVLDSIALMKRLGIWVEVTTLVVPGMNDGDEELGDIARFLAGIDRDLPWHISRFHSDYQFSETPATPLATLERAVELGKEAGLRFIYVGNIAGGSEDTLCPNCGRLLIRRRGFSVSLNKVEGSRCSFCGAAVGGVF